MLDDRVRLANMPSPYLASFPKATGGLKASTDSTDPSRQSTKASSLTQSLLRFQAYASPNIPATASNPVSSPSTTLGCCSTSIYLCCTFPTFFGVSLAILPAS